MTSRFCIPLSIDDEFYLIDILAIIGSGGLLLRFRGFDAFVKLGCELLCLDDLHPRHLLYDSLFFFLGRSAALDYSKT